MTGRPRTYSTRLLVRWADFVGLHSALVLFLSFLVTAGVLIYTVNHFRIDTEMTDMISANLPYRKLEKEFEKAFPQFANTILIVMDAEIPEVARAQTKRLVERLMKERAIKQVYWPGSGEFFERNGLLYLNVKELEDLSDRLAAAQPLLGLLSRDFSLRGLFSVLDQLVSQEGDVEQREKVVPFLDRLSDALDAAASNRPFQFSWQEFILGKEAAKGASRQFIVLEPTTQGSGPSDGETAIEAIYRIRDEMGAQTATGVTMRLTGDVVLNHENLVTVKKGMGLTTLVSFILVAVALVIGLGSGRLVFACLMTLLVGLIWTLGFAIFFVGHLNLVSVAFGVLFIGLGIDYGIQYCLRYRELVALGQEPHQAIVETAKGLGVGLRLCTVAAAISFYSFLPTSYTGVSELGLIAGTGMFINLFATLTILPTLLVLLPLRRDSIKTFLPGNPLYQVPYRHAKTIRISAILMGIGAAFFLPGLYFDYNPLSLYDPHSQAITTFKELFKNERTSPWTISILTRNCQEAEAISGKLRNPKEVNEVITISSFIPVEQSKKLVILSDIAFFMPPGLEPLKPETVSNEEKVKSLKRLETSLKRSLLGASKESRDYSATVNRLSLSLEGFKRVLDDPGKSNGVFDRFEKSVLSNLPVLFQELKSSLQASAVKESDLPPELRARYVTPDGRYRVEVLPRENILKPDALKRFVEVVTALAPNSTDAPVTIREAGNAVVHSFLQATLYALLAISLYLLIELKSVSDTALILLPLAFSLLMTGAGSVVFDIPFNFANVIVIPLLLGSGVEGIYLVYRFRSDPPPNGNMLETSTARALFLSTLTTILSFSALSFSSHQGMASMGKLLTICIGSLMVSTLVLLPALLPKKRDRQDKA